MLTVSLATVSPSPLVQDQNGHNQVVHLSARGEGAFLDESPVHCDKEALGGGERATERSTSERDGGGGSFESAEASGGPGEGGAGAKEKEAGGSNGGERKGSAKRIAGELQGNRKNAVAAWRENTYLRVRTLPRVSCLFDQVPSCDSIAFHKVDCWNHSNCDKLGLPIPGIIASARSKFVKVWAMLDSKEVPMVA